MSPKFVNKLTIVSFFLFASFIIFLLIKDNGRSYVNKINIFDNQNISWGKGWKNKKSYYSGSELRFSITNTKTISSKVSVPKLEPIQEMEIGIEGKFFYLSSPDLNKKELTIYLDKESYNKPQEVRIRYFCVWQFIPCEVTVESIFVDRSAKLLPPPNLPKTLAILGDSISSNFGSQNFTGYLADHLGYQLHNASIYQSTISKMGSGIDGVSRYKKDITDFKPEFVLIIMGANDILKNIPVNEFGQSYKGVVEGIKKYSPKSKIISSGVFKSKALDSDIVDDFNNAIQKIAISENIIYVDPSGWLSDGDFMDTIHPSIQAQGKLEKGYFDVISKITD